MVTRKVKVVIGLMMIAGLMTGWVAISNGQDKPITLKLGSCQIVISQDDINVNNGMLKITTAGASLVNDAFKVGV